MIAKVIAWENGMVMVFDRAGNQVSQYQGGLANVRARILRDAPADCDFRTGPWGEEPRPISRDDFAKLQTSHDPLRRLDSIAGATGLPGTKTTVEKVGEPRFQVHTTYASPPLMAIAIQAADALREALRHGSGDCPGCGTYMGDVAESYHAADCAVGAALAEYDARRRELP